MLNENGSDRRNGEDGTADYVASLYAQNGPDIGFWRILNDLGQLSDERLAELIEEDGRHRIARGLPVRLDRYITAVPDLFDRCEPVDAAIDVTLRSLCGASRPDAVTVQSLIDQYPQIESLIREAAALNEAMWSTYEVREDFPGGPRDLPQDFGPSMETGESRYELRKLIGSGAFGQVYLAVDRLLSEQDRPALVAIKILNPRKRTRWSRERLIEEASKARRIDHPNVVRVLDRGVSAEDEDYITYELISGGDLSQWLRQRGGKTEPREAARFVSKIAHGVQAAHTAGVVHCDLNPGNVILTEDGEPKIADFGVAIRTEETRQREIRSRETGRAIGNKLYISPEQYRCEEGSLSVPSDVYALGGILFTILSGGFPNGSDLDEIARIHHPDMGRRHAPSVRSLRPEVDRDLDAICRRALAPQPDNRYSSAGMLADDLDSWLRSEPIYWTRPSMWHIARLWVRRKPAVASISLLLLVSVILGGTFTLYLSMERDRIELLRRAEEIRAVEAEHARREEEHRAELERVRAEEQITANRNAAKHLSEIVTYMRDVQANRASTQFLSIIWTIQFLFDTDVLGTPTEPTDLWRARFAEVERLIKQADEQGRSSDLDAMLWRTTLAFWLTATGDVESIARAESMLDDLEAQWASTLQPGDRWLGFMHSLRHCAAVKRLTAANDPICDESLLELHSARAVLEHYEPLLEADDPGSSLHFLFLESMVDLYALLGEEELRQNTAARRDQFASPLGAR